MGRGSVSVSTGKIPNLHVIGFGDNISSIKNGGISSCRLYQHSNYSGLLGTTLQGDYNSLGYVGWSDKISSVDCIGGGSITLCEDAQWKGNCVSVSTASSLHTAQYDYIGDKASSAH